jgi:import inner membrane translocase subunit TIM21
MIMTFYVQGRPEGETVAPSESSYLESTSTWLQDKGNALSELSYDEVVEWSRDTAKNLWDRSVRAFKYLSGTPLPPPTLPEITAPNPQELKTEDRVAWGFAGLFSSLKGAKSSGAELTTRRLGRHFTEGEVHADLVKVNDL